MRGIRLSLSLIAAACLLALGSSVQAAAPYYAPPGVWTGDSWTPGVFPMDLSAAVSDNGNLSSDWVVEMTNYGISVFDAHGGTSEGHFGLWDFWCNGTGLSGCTTSASSGLPYDPQIAYNWKVGRWIVASLSPIGPETGTGNPSGGGSYLLIGVSQDGSPLPSGNFPSAGYFTHSVALCSDVKGSNGEATFGDNPIMGISHSTSTTGGRVVVDVLCFSTASGNYVADEIYDFSFGKLENGTVKDKVFVSTNLPPTNLFKEPMRLRPRRHLGSGGVIALTSVSLTSSGIVIGGFTGYDPVLDVYRLVPSSNGVTSDNIKYYNSYKGNTPTSGTEGVLAPQPGTSDTIRVDDLDTDNGDISHNANSGDDVFATSFAGAYPDLSGSVYYLFDLNLANGNTNLITQNFNGGDQVSYPAALIDDDNELTLNYTIFSSTEYPTSYLDYYDFRPVNSPPTFEGSWTLAASSAPLTSACQNSVCRWGDYTANVFDPSCDAAADNLTPECHMFWQVTEYTPDGTTQASNVTAVYDLEFSNDTK